MKKKKKKEFAKLKTQIFDRVGQVEFQKEDSEIFTVGRTIDPNATNNIAEQIQKIRGTKVLGTDDLFVGSDLVQIVRFRYRKPVEQLVLKPTPRPKEKKSKAVLYRDGAPVIRRDPNWYTRATTNEKPFVPYYLREQRNLYEPIG